MQGQGGHDPMETSSRDGISGELAEQRYQLLLDTSLDLASSLGLSEVLRSAARRLSAGLQIPDCDIYRLEGGDRMVCLASTVSGVHDASWVGYGFLISDWPCHRLAIETRRTVVVAALSDPLLSAPEREVMRHYGERSCFALPLIAHDKVVGLVDLLDHVERTFTDDEIAVAEAVGQLVALALERARLYEEQRDIAVTLQENFVHPLPVTPCLELGVVASTAFEPELVGGDFSDVFVLDDTHVLVLIGDVAGKGVRAAGYAETVRSEVRAFATIEPSPAFILAKTNGLLLRGEPDDPHVTAFLCVLDPCSGRLSYASAGHPAPVHLGAFSCGVLGVSFGPPLGSFEHPYADAYAMLALGDYLVFYTDGVTEARRAGEMLGEDRLVESASKLRGRSAQEVAAGVREAALAFAGRLHDDLQVVVLHLT